MSIHHPFSPSVLERRELCPGSFALEKRLPEAEPGDVTKRGVLLHSLIADKLSKKEILCNEDDMKIVDRAVSFIDSLKINDKAEKKCEYKTSYQEEGKEIYYGTVDFVAVDKESKEAIIVDWKTGYGDVTEAENNLQGAAYALAIMQEFSVPHVTVHFFNPTLNQYSSYVFKNWRVILTQIKKIIETASAENAPLIPGDKQCKYCKAAILGCCPAIYHNINSITARDAESFNIEKMQDSELVSIYEKAKMVNLILEAIEKEIKKRCENIGACGKYRLRTSPGAYDVKIKEAYSCLCKSENDWNLSPEKFLECCSVSFTQLKKMFASDAISEGIFKTKKEAEEVLTSRLSFCLERKNNRKILFVDKNL